VFFLKFLTDHVEPNDHVTRSFIEHMIPAMMEQYAVKSAKGGEHSRDKGLDEQTRSKFEEKDDQSMVSHQLNGIFPVMRLLNLLEAEGLCPVPFSEVERRVYILAYLMHDVDKIVQMRGVETRDREDIERAKDLVAEQLRMCNVEAFFPDFAAYLEDITYLVVNTQQKWGTNLHTYLWRFQLPERRVLLLRRLCTYSDHIAYLVSSPSAILSGAETGTLTTILAELSDDELVFTYHQLREVRGLLTNVVNNGMIRLFTEGHGGIWPYLFFSDGVVYIKRKSLQIHISTEEVVETVRTQLREICADRIKRHAPGFKFSIQGIAKHPGYYFEFLTLEEYAELLAHYTIQRTTNDISAIPLGKLRQMQANDEIATDIPTDFTPDPRIGMLSRFFSVVFMTLLDKLDKKQNALREHVEQEVVKRLGLVPYWAQSQAIPNKGGVEYRWFWLGACYLRDHPGIDLYDGEDSLFAVFNSTLELVIKLAGDELRNQMPQNYLNHLTSYLDSIIELPLAMRAEGTLPDFQAELERYAGAKSKGRKLICTLCNSAYPTEEQADNAVLFQPWVYKNKLSLYAGKNAGGICAICALELMLRQILQKGQLRLTGSKFEALKTKYLAVYPNFFFTAETGAMVRGILDQLRDINFFTIRRQLEGEDITVGDLLALEAFAAPKSNEVIPQVFVHDDDSDETEVGEEEDETEEAATSQSSSTERSYIKFRQDSYPGLFFFGMRAGTDDDDTSTWAMPAFLALALSLVTNTKIVISEMSLPLFASGRDFRETVIFDAPHPYLNRLLKRNRIRVNELLPKLRLLTSIYRVNLDTYAKQGKPEWKHLSGIARDLETDPLFLFSYLRKQQRGERRESLYASEVGQYKHIYEKILEEDLGNIQNCVDRYTVFYRGGYQSHSILKPVDIVARAIINSPLDIEPDDLLWQIQGELKNWLDRVRSRQAMGYAVFWGKDIDSQEAPALREFVRYFYEEVFMNYCQGERGILRSRLNRFKDGCEAYYIYQRNMQRIQEQEQEPEPNPVA
jgi:CRISPR-associated protein Csc3